MTSGDTTYRRAAREARAQAQPNGEAMTDHPPREHGVSSDLRAALGRLTTGERQTPAVRGQETSDHWETTNPAHGRVWQAMTSLVLDDDRMERARAAGGAEAHTMREARRARK